MAERNLSVDHVTSWRWVQRYATVLNQRTRRIGLLDETYIMVSGNWPICIVWSIPRTRQSSSCYPKRDLIAAKLFLRLALSAGGPPPRVINVDGHPAYPSAVAE